MRIREKFLHSLFKRWGFLRLLEMPQDETMYAAFEQLWQSIGTDSILRYDLPYKKAYFNRWLTQEKGVLLHGSNRAGIEELTPKKQTNFKGQAVEAVFALGWTLADLFCRAELPKSKSTGYPKWVFFHRRREILFVLC